MANKQMNKCSTSFIIMKMKTTRSHYKPHRMAKIKMADNQILVGYGATHTGLKAVENIWKMVWFSSF